MKRRDAIKQTALLLGYAVSASSIAAVMNGCKADPKVVTAGLDNWTPVSMTKDQGQLLAQIAESVLPKTDTSGAIEAGVHAYIDTILKNLASPEQVSDFKTWIDDFTASSTKMLGKPFLNADEKERNSFLTDYENKAAVAKQKNEKPLASWFTIKEHILLGYFTSEVGQKEALVYLPIPGGYKGCIPLEEVGGTWAI
jgi:glucoside 3-dehydrogenase (cytochrome c) hitch-hiker subunit